MSTSNPLPDETKGPGNSDWVLLRKNGREWMVKLLYAMNLQQDYSVELMESLLKEYALPLKEETFIRNSMKSALDRLDRIDDAIRPYLKDWDFERLPKVDKAILRMATNEILYDDSIPVGVSINEAVEISKKYCDPTSYRFLNGVLGQLARNRGQS